MLKAPSRCPLRILRPVVESESWVAPSTVRFGKGPRLPAQRRLQVCVKRRKVVFSFLF